MMFKDWKGHLIKQAHEEATNHIEETRGGKFETVRKKGSLVDGQGNYFQNKCGGKKNKCGKISLM